MARLNYVQTKSPTWMQSVWDLVAAELVAHGLFTFVETVNSPGGMPCSIFKASGAISRLGRDWYLAMARLANNPTGLYFAVAEGYDTTTKSLIRPAPGNNRSSTIPASDGSYGGGTGYPIWTGTTGSTLNTADIYWNYNAPGAYVVDCWTLVTNDGIYLWGQSPGRSGSYFFNGFFGTIEPLQANDPGILISSSFLDRGFTGAPGALATRHPTVTTAMPYTWAWVAPSNSTAEWTPSTGSVNGAGDRLFNGRPIGGRRALRTNHTGANLATYGDLRGLWPGMLCISTSGGGDASDSVMPGEQMTIYDQQGVGSTYIYAYRYGSSGNELWLNLSVP